MPSRYWVGGTAAWDGTAGTKWAATSGGAGGESVPTTSDDVFFDANSTGTVTIAAGNTGAASINCTGFTGTITGTAAITVAGSVTLDAGQTYTHTGTMTFTGTGTLTTAGKTFGEVVVNGAGITLTLGDALTTATAVGVLITLGNFDTANYNVTITQFSSNNNNARVITLGSSTVTMTGGFNVFNIGGSNLTFNAGTSQINLNQTTVSLLGGSQTFYNVSFTSTSAGTRTITGANTFNDLTLNVAQLDTQGLTRLILDSDQTVNGTFTCAGLSAIRRGFVLSNTIGTTRTITAAAISANDCDFRDITLAGAAAGASPTRAGDCGGNSGITFPAAKTVYRVGTNTNWTGSSSWALTSGGSGSNDNYPLPQDTAVINEDTALTGTLSFLAGYNIGALDASARTTAITLSHNAPSVRHGSYILGSGVTVSDTSAQVFAGRGTMVFTSAGKTITFPITVDAPGGTFQLGDAYSASNMITHTRGTFDANNYNVTCTRFDSSNSNTRTITMGSGLWTISGTGTTVGGSPWILTTITNLTFNKDTADILLSDTSSNNRTFRGGGLSYNKLTIGGATGTSITDITQVNSFTELASTKTVAHTVRFAANQGTIDTWSITGSAGNVVTVDSSVAGTRRTFNLTNVTSGIDYLSVKDIGVNQTDRFYVGANSTDGGNNLNVIFARTPNINVSNLVLTLQEKINSSIDENEIHYYANAIKQLKSGIIYTVDTLGDLPNVKEFDGNLYFVKSEETIYISRIGVWVPLEEKIISPLFSWGSGGFGQLGDGTTVCKCSPVREISSSTNWCQVSADGNRISAIKTTGELWNWGINTCGRLGDGTTVCKCSPVREISSSTNWCQVSADSVHTSAIKTTGEIWSWGSGNSGALGDGTTVNKCSPVQEISSSTNWCQVGTGYRRGHAVKTTGELWSWGCNRCGALGNGTTTDTFSPIREISSSTNWCQVSGRSCHSSAIKTTGEIWSWGGGGQGRLGNGSTTDKCSPVREISSSTNWCQVSAGGLTTSAVKTTGEIWSWGFSSCGVLGDGTAVDKCSPVREISSSTDWCQVSAGFLNMSAVKTSGQLWSWGENVCGQLGDGTLSNKCSPIREISSSTNWCQVSAGSSRETVAIKILCL